MLLVGCLCIYRRKQCRLPAACSNIFKTLHWRIVYLTEFNFNWGPVYVTTSFLMFTMKVLGHTLPGRQNWTFASNSRYYYFKKSHANHSVKQMSKFIKLVCLYKLIYKRALFQVVVWVVRHKINPFACLTYRSHQCWIENAPLCMLVWVFVARCKYQNIMRLCPSTV